MIVTIQAVIKGPSVVDAGDDWLLESGLRGSSWIGYVQGWPEPYIHTVYDRMCGDFPAKNTVFTP